MYIGFVANGSVGNTSIGHKTNVYKKISEHNICCMILQGKKYSLIGLAILFSPCIAKCIFKSKQIWMIRIKIGGWIFIYHMTSRLGVK